MQFGHIAFLEFNAVQGSMTVIDVKINDLVFVDWTVQSKDAMDSPGCLAINPSSGNRLEVDWDIT